MEKIKITIPAQNATPAPPVGAILSQKGVNLMAFCKEFNATTEIYKKNVLLSVVIGVDPKTKSYVILKKSPVIAPLLLKSSVKPEGRIITIRQIYDLAVQKKREPHFAEVSLSTICQILMGSLKTMNFALIK